MKKHELLKHAYDNYPKGTKFINLGRSDRFECETTGSFYVDEFGVRDSKTGYFIYGSGKWAKIVPEQPQKIAVKVEDEKEYYSLMKYYDGLGWKPWNAHDIEKSHNSGEAIDFHDNYRSAIVEIQEMDNYKIIPFLDFAKEHNIKLPLIKSEDGVWLYLDSPIVVVRGLEISAEYDCVGFGGSYNINPKNPTLDGQRKIFSTKQAALDWIEAQKPKYPKVNSQSDPFGKLLHYEVEVSDRGSILVGTKAITINGVVQVVSKSIIEDILKAMKELS